MATLYASRRCHVDPVTEALAAEFRRRVLVLRVGVEMQEADCDRADIFRLESVQCRIDGGDIDRRLDFARVQGAFADGKSQIAPHQRLVGRHQQVVHGSADVLQSAAALQFIPEALGREHADLGAPPGEQRIGRHGRSMDDEFDSANELAHVLAVGAGGFFQAVEQTLAAVLGRGQRLECAQPALRVHDQTVGERAPHIDRYASHRLPRNRNAALMHPALDERRWMRKDGISKSAPLQQRSLRALADISS